MKKIPINYNGEQYPSLRNFCLTNGYNYRLILQRIQSGKTLEEAIRNCDLNYINGKEIEYKGKFYPSLTSLCESLNIKTSTVQGRLKNGWTLEDAIETPIRDTNRRTPKILIYQGQVFETLKDLCEEFGFNYANTSTRLRRGYSFEEALEKPVEEPKIPKYCVYNGKEYSSEKELCEDFKVSYIKFLKLRKEGFSIEEALLNATVRSKEVMINGKVYKSLTEASKETGLSLTKIRYRCNSDKYKEFKRI